MPNVTYQGFGSTFVGQQINAGDDYVRTIVSPTDGAVDILSIAVNAGDPDPKIVGVLDLVVMRSNSKADATYDSAVLTDPSSGGWSVAFRARPRVPEGGYYRFNLGELRIENGQIAHVIVQPIVLDSTGLQVATFPYLSVQGVAHSGNVPYKLR